MPKSVLGKLCLLMLVIFFIQIVLFMRMMSINFFGAMVQFIKVTPYTSIIGIILGLMSLNKEREKRIVPVITLIVSIIFLAIFLLFLFGFSFGG